MTGAEIFALILGIVKAVPIFNSWVEKFVAFYIEKQISDMVRQNREAIRKAIDGHDQREAERALGNPNPGGPSNVPGVVIVDSLPGVKNEK